MHLSDYEVDRSRERVLECCRNQGQKFALLSTLGIGGIRKFAQNVFSQLHPEMGMPTDDTKEFQALNSHLPVDVAPHLSFKRIVAVCFATLCLITLTLL